MNLRALSLPLLFFMITACSKQQGAPEAGPRNMQTDKANKTATNQGRRTLAYEHDLNLQTDSEKVAGLYDKALALCAADSANECNVLSAQIGNSANYVSRSYISASLTFRAKSAGIKQLMTGLSTGNHVVNQATRAEDLAQPIVDNDRHIAMLQEYRNKLEELNARGSKDLDTLMKLSKEIANVQAELESAKGDAAKLAERVNTEILHINISSEAEDETSLASPIKKATSRFLGNLAEGVSNVITALAYLLPWLLVLVPLWLGIRRYRRKK